MKRLAELRGVFLLVGYLKSIAQIFDNETHLDYIKFSLFRFHTRTIGHFHKAKNNRCTCTFQNFDEDILCNPLPVVAYCSYQAPIKNQACVDSHLDQIGSI